MYKRINCPTIKELKNLKLDINKELDSIIKNPVFLEQEEEDGSISKMEKIVPKFRFYSEDVVPREKREKIDFSYKQTGFLYVLQVCKSQFDSDYKVENYSIKIGCTKNPVFRLGQHKFDTFLNKSICIIRVVECFDYLKCEAEIKKLTDGKEQFSFDKEILKKIHKILDKYKKIELDVPTMELLLKVKTLKTNVQKFK